MCRVLSCARSSHSALWSFAGLGTMGTASNPFRAGLSNWSGAGPLSGFSFFFFLSRIIVQEHHNIGVGPLISVLFIRKSHSEINQPKSISVPLTLLYWFSFSFFSSSFDLLNTIILLAIPEGFCYHLFKIKDVIIM